MIMPNETLQLNELLILKSLSLSKTLLMSPMIADPDLKEILLKDAGVCESHVKELRGLMEQSTVRGVETINHFTEDGGNET
uniref:hypothetical protein n=1 Tax=Clostridium sp. 12(A) TaxID=1163671 RepID=UPI000685B30F|nr:hypothetical protein [Clostridium sp. 12(A)]